MISLVYDLNRWVKRWLEYPLGLGGLRSYGLAGERRELGKGAGREEY